MTANLEKVPRPCKVQEKKRMFFQPKLTVGPTDEVYEREADTVADKVMRMNGHEQIQTKMSPLNIQRRCAACEEEEHLQRKYDSTAEKQAEAPRIVSDALDSGGNPLGEGTRSFMESRLGYDFSTVKIHTDTAAAKSAQSINALAYTSGNNIVFNNGQYAPSTHQGKRLLAHELTHVVQQGTDNVLAKKILRWDMDNAPIGDPERDVHLRALLNNPPNPNLPIDINAVDSRSEPATPWYLPWRYTGNLAGFFRADVTMTNVQTMVDNIITFKQQHTIHRLNIMDHGNSTGIEIGDDWITASTLPTFRSQFSRLRGMFSSSGFVHLNHCDAGQSQTLVCDLASTLGVTVFAQTGAYNPIYQFTFGDYVSCDPSGTFNPRASRP